MKNRLLEDLRHKIPPAMEGHLNELIEAVFDFHDHREAKPEPFIFDFPALRGESLIPSRESTFGVADFLKLSQAFERSMVGLILASDLTADEKTGYIYDVQSFFDNFDTTLLDQLEEELIARGLLYKLPSREPEAADRMLARFGLSKELADELADPVLLEVNGEIAYFNPSAESLLGKDYIKELDLLAFGISGEAGEQTGGPGKWGSTTFDITSGSGKKREIPATWKTATSPDGQITLVMLPGASALLSTEERVDYLARESRHFQLLYRLSRELSKGYDIEGLFTRLAEELSAMLGYDALLLHIHDPAKGRVLFHLATPFTRESLGRLWENSCITLCECVDNIEVRDVEILVVNPQLLIDGQGVESKARVKQSQGPRLDGSFFILPLSFENEILGSFGIYISQKDVLSDEDLKLFTTFTNHLALALKNVVAVEGMRKLLRDNREQIELARRVQSELLPEPGEFKRLKFRTLFKPAAGLSGDFYQFFAGGGFEGLVIGDASGHGISASLIMAVAGETFRDACSADICDPLEILREANASLKDALGDDFFVTALIFGVNPDTLEAKYTSAGQEGPILIKPEGKLRQLKTAGIPLGMFADPLPYTLHRVKLEPGDRLLFFTDGAVEGRNTKRKMYGTKRLCACIKKNAHLTGDELLQAIVDDVISFLSHPDKADDMTLILMEIH